MKYLVNINVLNLKIKSTFLNIYNGSLGSTWKYENSVIWYISKYHGIIITVQFCIQYVILYV